MRTQLGPWPLANSAVVGPNSAPSLLQLGPGEINIFRGPKMWTSTRVYFFVITISTLWFHQTSTHTGVGHMEARLGQAVDGYLILFKTCSADPAPPFALCFSFSKMFALCQDLDPKNGSTLTTNINFELCKNIDLFTCCRLFCFGQKHRSIIVQEGPRSIPNPLNK